MRKKKKPDGRRRKPKPPGRPTDYRAHYADQAHKLSLLGYLDEDLASFFNVDKVTIERWKLKHPKFCNSIRLGKAVPDANVAASLYQKAVGFTRPGIKVVMSDGQPIDHPIIEYYPPDTTAQTFWLRNRQAKLWKDKVTTEVTGADGGAVIVQTMMDRAREIAKLKAKGES